jgi:hypothetical protein
MEILLILALVWFVAALMNISDPKNNKQQPKPTPCYEKNEPHDWTYNYQDKFQCTVCGYVAGE